MRFKWYMLHVWNWCVCPDYQLEIWNTKSLVSPNSSCLESSYNHKLIMHISDLHDLTTSQIHSHYYLLHSSNHLLINLLWNCPSLFFLFILTGLSFLVGRFIFVLILTITFFFFTLCPLSWILLKKILSFLFLSFSI